MWLQGIPGAGKTVLFSQLIRFMSAADLPMIHHFCSHSFASSLAYDNILQLLVLKLTQRHPDLISFVYDSMVVMEKTPTRAALQKLALELVSMSPRVSGQGEYLWILLDGMDECPEDHQKALVKLLGLMVKASKQNGTIIKVLFSSRQSPILNPLLKRYQLVSLTARKKEIDASIRQYISQRLLTISVRLDAIDVTPSVRETMETCIVKKSAGKFRATLQGPHSHTADWQAGMFLYAKLVVDYITSNIFYSAEEIMKSVMALPERLNDLYELENPIFVRVRY